MSQSKSFLPADFEIPVVDIPGGYQLRPLGMDDLARDYTAVMSSIDHLRTSGHLQPPGELDFDWPRPDIEIRFHLTMLGEAEWAMHNLARVEYAIRTDDEQLGCLYVFPSLSPDYDAQLTMWVRSDVFTDTDLDSAFWEYSKAWVREAFPFERIAFPGRDLSWDEYLAGVEQ
jgi:hypothetical protein